MDTVYTNGKLSCYIIIIIDCMMTSYTVALPYHCIVCLAHTQKTMQLRTATDSLHTDWVRTVATPYRG